MGCGETLHNLATKIMQAGLGGDTAQLRIWADNMLPLKCLHILPWLIVTEGCPCSRAATGCPRPVS